MASNSINVKKKFKRIVHIDAHLATKDIDSTSDIVAIICLDDFTEKNRATKIWPKSHLSGIKIHKNKNKNKLINKKHLHMSAK